MEMALRAYKLKTFYWKNYNMRIIIPLFGATYHGGTRVLFQIANELSQEGNNVEIVCPRKKYNPIYDISDGVTIKLVEISFLPVYCIYLVFYILFTNNRHIFLSHWLTGILHSPSIFFRGHGTYLVQDTEEVFYPKKTFTGKVLRYFVFMSYRMNHKNMIVTTSYGARKLSVINGLNNKAEMFPLGINKQVFKVNKDTPREKVILCFPRIGEFKGFELLKNTLNLIKNDEFLSRYKVVCISQEKNLKKDLYGLYDEFRSVNNDLDLASVYNKASILLHTSKYEGVCLPILEAISCGCRVVCTNSFGPAHYLSSQNSGVTAVREPEVLLNLLKLELKKEIKKSEIAVSVLEFSIQNFVKNTVGYICNRL